MEKFLQKEYKNESIPLSRIILDSGKWSSYMRTLDKPTPRHQFATAIKGNEISFADSECNDNSGLLSSCEKCVPNSQNSRSMSL